jgi:ATP-dependent Clp protease protease subunit
MSSAKQSDFDLLMNYNIDIRGRTLYLDDEIDEETASRFIKCIRYLDKTAGTVTIIVNCEGGCCSNGFAIYDAIKLCKNEVDIKVIGSVMSMATIVLQAGDKRSMSVNSRLMLHRGEIALSDHITNVERAIKESKKIETKMIDIYLDKIQEINPDFKRNQLQKLLEFDTYMSAQKCMELGLIDEVDGD